MNKVALITGSSSGFGELTTHSFSKAGYTVYATMRNINGKNKDKASKLEALNGVTVLDLDVTDQSSIQNTVNTIISKEGKIDFLVNNAGIGSGGFTEPFSASEFQKVFDVNVFGVQRLMNAVLPSMRKNQNGLVVNVSSVMGRMVIPYSGAYTASKWAVEGLSESYKYELAQLGIDVAIVEPGGFGTNFINGMIMASDEDRVNSYGELNNVPQQMWQGFAEHLQSENGPNPQEVADAILNLTKLPNGQRPLRTVVDPMTGGEGPKVINATSDKVQEQFFASMQTQDTASSN